MAQSENLFGWFARFMMPVIALTVGGRLDAALERALLTKMRELSPAQRTNLFDGYGPLSSFAAKIDVAYALGIFDDAIYTDLTVIRKIRNVFAHPQGKVDQAPDHFDDDPEMITLCKRFTDSDASIKPSKLFERKIAQCILALSKDPEDIELANKTLASSAAQALSTDIDRQGQ